MSQGAKIWLFYIVLGSAVATLSLLVASAGTASASITQTAYSGLKVDCSADPAASGSDTCLSLDDTGGTEQYKIDGNGDVTVSGREIDSAQSVSFADTGDANAATGTVTPNSNYIELTCNDGNGGCDVDMDESGATEGQKVTLVNVSSNAFAWADDNTGVQDLAGSFSAMGQYDSLTFRYIDDRWVEVARADN